MRSDPSFGGFDVEEVDGKQFLVYHPSEPPMNSDNTENNDLSVPPLFLCPFARVRTLETLIMDAFEDHQWNDNLHIIQMDHSPYFNNDKDVWKSSDPDNHHYVLPLFWCKNKDVDEDGLPLGQYTEDWDYSFCSMCSRSLEIGTDYYFCVKCDKIYHKECVECAFEIKHPYHLDHPLQLYKYTYGVDCGHCQSKVKRTFVYQCTLCDVSIDTICALKPIPFVLEKTKRHDHPLTFFTRKDHLRCNVCGTVNKNHDTYVCFKCDFVAHEDCANFPSIIRISRENDRISFISSIRSRKWKNIHICQVCYKNVDSDYGVYSSSIYNTYHVVHPRCALREDIWDGKELEGIPEDIEKVVYPFKRISDGIILHFSHGHYLKLLKINGEVYDETKICQACVLPIYEGKFYSCVECNFILHNKCAEAPRRKYHPLHPHPLTLKVTNRNSGGDTFTCNACCRESSGFVYECSIEACRFKIDVKCGFISESFRYQDHKHFLYLALDPEEKHSCQICKNDNKNDSRIMVNCIECDFIICLKCVSVPYMVRYKHDNHFLTLTHRKETDEPDWCEICERLLIPSKRGEDGEDKRFYECKICCTTLHINCLLGENPYIKSGHTILPSTQVVANNSLSRPNCDFCDKRCVDKIFFKTLNSISCRLRHVPDRHISKKDIYPPVSDWIINQLPIVPSISQLFHHLALD